MYNILVCDDEKDIVSALTIYLQAEGYRVFGTENGLQALEILRREQVHLVLLDIMMPGLDGLHTMQRLREFSNVPVILLTAKSEDNDKILGLTAGADDYVTKPLQPHRGHGARQIPASPVSAARRRQRDRKRSSHRGH